MKSEEISRRSFLKRALALSAVSAIPSFWTPAHGRVLPTSPLISANDRVNIAFIGIGQRGGEIAKELYNTGLCNVVALCDVDMGAPHTQEIINMFPKAARFQDFRTMFDRMADKIDAVSVGVPDHSHFPITIEAMAHGKHVYVEKPMARTFQEIEIMMRGAKKYGVVTQMGNQGHSEANYFQFKAWKEAGIIKDVTAITAHMNNPRRWHGWNPNIRHMPMGEPVPETMDWDTWIGVAQYHDYNHDYHLGQWRCWYDFGMGVLGDWGAHILDTAHEFLDLGLPTEINPLYLKDHNPFFFPMSSTLLFKFPERGNMPAVDITWYDGLDNKSYLISFHIFLSSSDDLVFEDMDRFIEATVVISHGKNEVCLSNFVRKMYGIVRYVPYKGAKNESGVFSNEIELEDKGLDYSFVAGKTFNEK